MSTLSQKSFAAGELTPSLYARTDITRYGIGLRTLRNFIVLKHGGVENRPGTTFIQEAGDSTKNVKLIPFITSDDVAFMLEFGDQYIRFHRNGLPELEAAKTITNVTNSSTAIVTCTAHGYSAGDEIYISGIPIDGMRGLEGRNFVVAAPVNANDFALNDKDGNPVDTQLSILHNAANGGGAVYPAWSGTANVQRVYEVSSPYLETQLFDLDYVQSGDVLTITHPSHPPKDLKRYGNIDTFSTFDISGVATGSSAEIVVTATGHTFSNGDVVRIEGVAGTTELNNLNFVIENVATNTFELRDFFDSTKLTAYSSGGTASNIPWELTNTLFSREQERPLGLTITPVNPGTNDGSYDYQITAVDTDTFAESGLGGETGIFISAVSNSNPCQITTASGSSVATGDTVYLDQVMGVPELDKRTFRATRINSTTFQLQGIDSTNYGTYVGGNIGRWSRVYVNASNQDPLDSSNHNTVGWDSVENAREYRVYRRFEPSAGVVGNWGLLHIVQDDGSTSYSFKDDGATIPNEEIQPPGQEINLFASPNNYPSTVAYYQQRRVFANTNNNVEQIQMSRVGRFDDFAITNISQDDDPVTFTINGNRINEVKHIIDLGTMIVMTSGGEWEIQGDATGSVTPTNIGARQYSYSGSGDLKPILVNGSAIFLQARSRIARDLAFDFNIDGYKGNDLSLFSSHLFDGYTIIDWAYQQTPHSIIWAVRSDGVLLGLTYIKEQEMLAWHRHDFDGGVVESVNVIPEGNEDRVYVVVKRTVDSVERRYIERFDVRRIDDLTESVFCDGSVVYDGRNTDATKTMELTGSGWTYTDPLTITYEESGTPTNYFYTEDIDNEIHLTAADGSVVRCRITAVPSSPSSTATVLPNRTVPADLQGASNATSSWAKAVDSLDGMWHLEGKDISATGDKFVAANPKNDSYDIATVDQGRVTLDRAYTYITVGLPYISDMQTLDIDTSSAETLMDKRKHVGRVTMFLEKTRGLWVGADDPESDVAGENTEGLREIKPRNNEGYDDPASLKTENYDINIRGEWNSNGRIFVRQIDPMPATILAVCPMGLFPFKNKQGEFG